MKDGQTFTLTFPELRGVLICLFCVAAKIEKDLLKALNALRMGQEAEAAERELKSLVEKDDEGDFVTSSTAGRILAAMGKLDVAAREQNGGTEIRFSDWEIKQIDIGAGDAARRCDGMKGTARGIWALDAEADAKEMADVIRTKVQPQFTVLMGSHTPPKDAAAA